MSACAPVPARGTTLRADRHDRPTTPRPSTSTDTTGAARGATDDTGARRPAHALSGFGRRFGGGPHRAADLSASVSVFLIALPLSLGIALATGAPLQAGLVAAAVGGIVAARLGGAPLQVSGPAAGLTVVTAELIQVYGWRTTCAITVVAGLAQLVLAHVRVARSALAVSPAIVHGMLAGIGVTIALAQLHIVLGGSPESSAIANVRELPQQLADPHPAALAASALTVAVLLLWPRVRGRTGRVLRTIPGPLAAVVLATGFVIVSGLSLPRVDLPSWRSHALPELPQGPVLGLLAAVLTITLVASVESLLSAVAVDKLAAERTRSGRGPRVPRADLDRELRGQGAANVVSGALGGLPITGVAVRSAANVQAGAVTRDSAMLHGFWVVLAAALLVPVLELIPLAALAALVMVVGVQMVNLTHIRTVNRHREVLVYAATTAGVVLLGVLEGVLIGIAVAIGVSLHRLARTRITYTPAGRTPEADPADTAAAATPGPTGHTTESGHHPATDPGSHATTDPASADGADTTGPEAGRDVPHRVCVRGQLTFLAVPRLSRALGQVPEGCPVVVELDGSFMDHAAYETLQDWRQSHLAHGGTVEITGRSGARIAEPSTLHHCTPWTPWRNHQCTRSREEAGPPGHRTHRPERRGQLLGGVRNFQRITAPLVRDELARLARDGQQPSHLFLTCADSRLVTSMITSSGPGDLFTVRNIGNLVPLPGREAGDHSVAAAIEYAVHVLGVGSVTVCGHSGCGAMHALHASRDGAADAGGSLARWLDHGRPSLERAGGALGGFRGYGPPPQLADRPPADEIEALCLANVVQQLEHLRAHDCVAKRIAEGSLELHGMYFHVGEAQAYVLDHADVLDHTHVRTRPWPGGPPGRTAPAVFTPVRPEGPQRTGGTRDRSTGAGADGMPEVVGGRTDTPETAAAGARPEGPRPPAG